MKDVELGASPDINAFVDTYEMRPTQYEMASSCMQHVHLMWSQLMKGHLRSVVLHAQRSLQSYIQNMYEPSYGMFAK